MFRLGETLLVPTTLYVEPVLKLAAEGIELHSMAHITGGGLPGNIDRPGRARFARRS